MGPKSKTVANHSPTRTTSDQAEKKIRYPTYWIRYFESGELEVWQTMMYLLGFAEKFTSKNQCRKALKHTWVNIVDFFEAIKTCSRPQFFPNHYQLSRYTIRTRKFFPKKLLSKGSPLWQLFSNIVPKQGRDCD
ncbi:hypothetical protein F4815DRAFT_441032 [Daldinia loculata]|uniref:uncharacterized protein n=1 Tax=Daldinia loculata TaxID=103429 RepID=UPI0020C598EE|nr:uncharacterized protein F4817DRAFT_313481 [Daldinia loculata]KAI1649757.1 hypothetical protein F4817DRAFT_313481 [Daldinia loculata]KAI2784730.1 hypothetical protein F4815DRAFT_441032 [Daldinia loculata]